MESLIKPQEGFSTADESKLNTYCNQTYPLVIDTLLHCSGGMESLSLSHKHTPRMQTVLSSTKGQHLIKLQLCIFMSIT
jgi:hypothetical protein